jgi:DNA polymerase III epsilon subunit-like protein
MKLAIVDIETTGFVREKNNSIVEIAIVLCDTETRKTEILFNNIVRENTLSDYHKKNSWIFKNSDLRFSDVERAQDINTYRAEIQAILDKYKITAYNKSFDMGWLSNLGFRYKETKCLMKTASEYAKVLLNEEISLSEENVYRWLMQDKNYVEKHRALPDALDEAKILYKLCDFAEDPIIKESINQLRTNKTISKVSGYVNVDVFKPALKGYKSNKEVSHDPKTFEDKFDYTKKTIQTLLSEYSINSMIVLDEPAKATFNYKGKMYIFYYKAGRWGMMKGSQQPEKYYFCKDPDDLFTRFLNK